MQAGKKNYHWKLITFATSDRRGMSDPLHGGPGTAPVDNAAAGGENCQGGSGPGHC